MDRNHLLAALQQGNFTVFHTGREECHVRLDDDAEIMVQLSDGSIPEKRMDLLKTVLENSERHIARAVQQLNAFGLNIGNAPSLYGIFVGEFNFGAHGRYTFDGFTVSLTGSSWGEQIYTVQFKADGWPLGVSLWFT